MVITSTSYDNWWQWMVKGCLTIIDVTIVTLIPLTIIIADSGWIVGDTGWNYGSHYPWTITMNWQ